MTVSTLSILYFLSRLFGYISFTITRNPRRAFKSKLSLTYTVCLTICFIIVLTYFEVIRFAFIINESPKKSTIKLVKITTSIISSFRILWLLIVQIKNRNQCIRLFNDAYQLQRNVAQICNPNDETPFFDKNTGPFIPIKMIVKMIQATLIQTIILFYATHFRGASFAEYLVYTLKTSFRDLFCLIFSSWYFFSLLVVLQLYRHLNDKLRQSMNRAKHISEGKYGKSKMQLYCRISDEIDETASLYGTLTIFTNRINNYFSSQVLFTLFVVFTYTLSGVIYSF